MTARVRFAGEGSPSRANVDEASLNGMIALPAMGNDQSCGGDESKKIKMEVRKKGEGEDHFKAKNREKISFLQLGTYGNEKWPFDGAQIRNLKGSRCQWGRPTQEFGRPHLGRSGSQFSLPGRGHEVAPMQVVLDFILGLRSLICVEFY